MTRGILGEFMDFYRSARKLPGFTLKDQEVVWQQQGSMVEKLLSGGTKGEFLKEGKRIHEMFQLRQRFFYMLYPGELRDCLFWATKDWKYASEQQRHELEHYQLFTSFQPTNGDCQPKVVFSILVTTGGAVTPYTHPCLNVFPYNVWPFTLWLMLYTNTGALKPFVNSGNI